MGAQSISQFGDGLNASSNTTSFLVNRYGKPIQGEVNDKDFIEIDANKSEKDIYEYLKRRGFNFSKPASYYNSTEKAKDQPAIIELFQDFQNNNPDVKGVKVIGHVIGGQEVAPFYVIYDSKSFYGQDSLKDKINAKYDAEYVDAVKKGEMTKEQAMQALEQAGRKGSDAYAELDALNNQPTSQQNQSEIDGVKFSSKEEILTAFGLQNEKKTEQELFDILKNILGEKFIYSDLEKLKNDDDILYSIDIGHYENIKHWLSSQIKINTKDSLVELSLNKILENNKNIRKNC